MTGETAEFELLARAVWKQRIAYAKMEGMVLEPWGDGSYARANGVFEEVRAMLLALRDPTPGMVKASNKTANSHAADKWRAIIDYVLGGSL